jgi:hypothetical protein
LLTLALRPPRVANPGGLLKSQPKADPAVAQPETVVEQWVDDVTNFSSEYGKHAYCHSKVASLPPQCTCTYTHATTRVPSCSIWGLRHSWARGRSLGPALAWHPFHDKRVFFAPANRHDSAHPTSDLPVQPVFYASRLVHTNCRLPTLVVCHRNAFMTPPPPPLPARFIHPLLSSSHMPSPHKHTLRRTMSSLAHRPVQSVSKLRRLHRCHGGADVREVVVTVPVGAADD